MSSKNNTTANTDVELDQLVRADKLRLLYRQSFPAVFVSVFNAAILTAILWSVQNTVVLVTWLTLLGAASVARVVLFTQYWRLAPKGIMVLAWERPYFVTLLLSSVIWGVGGLVIMPAESPVHQMVIFYFLIGMSGGAISVYSAHRLMVLATIAIILLPTAGWFLLQGNLLAIGAGIGALIFFGSAVRAGKVLSIALHKSFKLTHELKAAKELAENLARIDVLTGLTNRRTFNEQGEISFNLCQRNNKQLAMIIMDIDHFKHINDTCGHAIGDETLRQVGDVLEKAVRKSDVCSRIGGEEFGILLQVSAVEEASIIAENLRKSLSGIEVLCDSKSFNITVSFGVAVSDSNLDTLFKHADDALYTAKRNGRNQVITYKPA